jgi:hypothetical protein
MDERPSFRQIWRRHPVFFWGSLSVLAILLAATAIVAYRVPQYRQDAAVLDARMSETERAARDRILESEARRGELAVALLQRELRLRALQEKRVHLAISLEDSMLYFRHGPATLRQVRVHVGSDSVVTGADGQSWRLVQALGERTLKEKQIDPVVTIPEWVYAAQSEAVPPEEERRMNGALGRYVLRLDDGTEIYSKPSRGPFAEGVKPAAFMADEQELRAIFEALRVDTPVYIY